MRGGSAVDFVVGADVVEDNLVFYNLDAKNNAVGVCDADSLLAFESSREIVKPKRRIKRVCLKRRECSFGCISEFRMLSGEFYKRSLELRCLQKAIGRLAAHAVASSNVFIKSSTVVGSARPARYSASDSRHSLTNSSCLMRLKSSANITTYLGMLLLMTHTGPCARLAFSALMPRRLISCAGIVFGMTRLLLVLNPVRSIAQVAMDRQAVGAEARMRGQVFPQLCVTAVVVPGDRIGSMNDDGVRFLENKQITGAIPEMVDEAVGFVARNTARANAFNKDARRRDRMEYPLLAVREAILNALIHRDYSRYTESTPVRIEIYPDRMEISNKGGLYGAAPLSSLGHADIGVRNPLIPICTRDHRKWCN